MAESKIKEFLQIAWVNVKILFVMLLFIEVLGQVIFLFKHGETRLTSTPVADHPMRKEVYEKHPFLVGRLRAGKSFNQGKGVFSSTPMGLRWTGGDEQDTSLIRIACVGGSSTYCVELADTDSWPAQLQQKLGKKYAVFNYGVAGYSTVEGIIQSALLIPEIKPDVILFYEGWNDMRNYHDPLNSPDYYHHGLFLASSFSSDDAELKCYNFMDALQKFSGMAYLVQMTRNVAINYLRKKGSTRFDSKFRQPDKIYSDPDPFIDRIYYRNLKTLNALAKNIGAIPVFIPQVMNQDFRVPENTSLPWTPYIESNSIPRLMNHFNTIMDSLCTAEHCMEMKDIHLRHPWTAGYFVDEGHFSKKGAELFASLVFEEIKKLNLENR